MLNVSGVNIQKETADSQNNVVSRNFSAVSTTTPNDSTHFSSNSKQKKENFWQKNWGKILLGALTIGTGAIVTKGKLWSKPVSFEKVQTNLAEIFGKKDLSKEETQKLLQTYKDIYKIKDKEEFIKKLFVQVKKDSGYGDNKKIYLTINDKKTSLLDVIKKKSISGGFRMETGEFTIYKESLKQDIFPVMVHEFRHVKQGEFKFRSIAARKTSLEYYVENAKKTIPEICKKNLNAVIKETKKLVNEIFERRKSIYGNLPKFKEGSPEDIIGGKYEDAFLNYVTPDKSVKKYKNNIMEQEAYKNTALAKEILKYIQLN